MNVQSRAPYRPTLPPRARKRRVPVWVLAACVFFIVIPLLLILAAGIPTGGDPGRALRHRAPGDVPRDGLALHGWDR